MKRRQLLQGALPWAATAFWPVLAQAQAQTGTGAGAGAGTVSSTVAATFGRLPSPARVQRVFAAGAPAGVLVAALAPDKLLGWPMQLSAPARKLLGPVPAALPHLGRLAGRGSTVSVETLLQLQPDVILDAGTRPFCTAGSERHSGSLRTRRAKAGSCVTMTSGFQARICSSDTRVRDPLPAAAATLRPAAKSSTSKLMEPSSPVSSPSALRPK